MALSCGPESVECFKAEAFRNPKLITKLLSDNTEFHRLVEDNLDLRDIATCFPRYRRAIMTKVMISDTEFSRLVEDNYDLQMTIRYFPECAAQIIRKVFGNPIFFDQLVKNDAGFRGIKPYVLSIPELKMVNEFSIARDLVKKRMMEEGLMVKVRKLDLHGFFATQEVCQTQQGALPYSIGMVISKY